MKNFYWLFALIFVIACNRTHNVKNAYQALDSKQYAVAADLLQYDFNKLKVEEKKAEKAFLLGLAYENMNNMETSGKWYQRAYKLGFGNKALLGYIRYTIWDERYEEAVSLYKTLQTRSNRSSLYRREIQQLKQAQLWVSQDTLQGSIVQSSSINSKYADYSLTILEDDKMIFTSDRPSSLNDENYKWTGHSYSDIYVTSRDDHFVTPWMEQVNSLDNDGIAAVHSNGNEIVFVRCYTDYLDEDAMCKLMKITKDAGEWSLPEVLDFVVEGANYGSPYWNKKGDVLFFSSNVKGGAGGYDIYGVSYMDGKFGLPFNLGSRINTEGNEKFPTIHTDTLYYSSDYLTGMGGLDIFKSFLRYDSTWSAPLNMHPPINSGGDDFSYVVDEMYEQNDNYSLKAYFSSSRKGGIGGDDIYEYFIKKKTIEEPEIDTVTRVVHLVLRTTYPLYNSDEDLRVIGKSDLPNVSISYQSKKFHTDKKGIWLNNPKIDKMYEIVLQKDNYFTQKLQISTRGILSTSTLPDTTIYYEVLMIPIRKNEEIVIQDIYYDYDKAILRSDALPALNNLYEMLVLNPKLIIELSSHTDCRGEVDYNQTLSARRAQSVVDFLVKKGIPSSRLKAKGYGMTLPVAKCKCEQCNDAEHQRNRRTSFKILED